MGLYPTNRKKSTAVNRRNRPAAFLFVIFFFGLFSIIVFMESFSVDNSDKIGSGGRSMGGSSNDEDDEDDFDDYSKFDISYEDQQGQGQQGQNQKNKLFEEKMSAESSVVVQVKKKKIPPLMNREPFKKTVKTPLEELFANASSIESDWQKVFGTKEKFYIYSAYYNGFYGSIRIIGATKTKANQHVQCRFYDNSTNHISTVDATIKTIRENWNLKYSAIFIVCYIADKKNLTPVRFVSIVSNPLPASPQFQPKVVSNMLRIQFPEEKSQKIVNFSVCVKPIHFNYDNLLPFLEWMEFHRIMGVEKFTFYNHTIGKHVGCVMKEYGDLVQVLPWSLPFVSQKEIRTEGLFAALNDCVYRHRGASRYLVLVDFDEMIVPRRTLNYSQLIDQLDTLSNRKKIGAYSLQNAFYYLQWPDDTDYNFDIDGYPLAESVSRQLLSLKKTWRRARLHPQKQRSKYICDPEKVIEAGNHFIWEMASGYYTLSVPPHLGALHHYRVCEFGGDTCTKSQHVVDKSSQKFGKLLAIRVADQLQKFAKKCNFNINDILKISAT